MAKLHCVLTRDATGICAAIDLIKRNNCYNFIIVEKSGGVGGTWHDNKYPGCCCDGTAILLKHEVTFTNSPGSMESPLQLLL